MFIYLMLFAFLRPLSILLSITGIAVAFWYPYVSLGILGAPLVLLWLFLMGVRSGIKAPPITLLSRAGQKMWQRYAHFYLHPFAGRAYSNAVSTFSIAVLAAGAVSLFKTAWWAVGGFAALYLLFTPMAKGFNPTNFLGDDEEKLGRAEVVGMLQAMAEEREAND